MLAKAKLADKVDRGEADWPMPRETSMAESTSRKIGQQVEATQAG